jgi:AraC-like DNA-binding protein
MEYCAVRPIEEVRMLAANIRQNESTATIRAAALGGLDRVLGRNGIRLASLCERVEVDPAHLRNPESRLPVSSFIELLELAATQAKDDALGLHLCSQQPLSTLGAMADMYLQSPDCLTAIQAGISWMSLHQEGATLELTIDGRHAVCAYTIRSPFLIECRQDTELAIARMLRFGRAISRRPDFVPTAVYFEHPTPRNVAEHRRVFGAPIYFSQSCNALVFPKELLRQPVKGSTCGAPRWRLPVDAPSPYPIDLSDQMRRRITRLIRRGRTSINECAAAFGWHVRTLQRRLKAVGVTYDELLETTRHDLALHYLKQRHLTLTEIGSLLGYAELSTFSRAFRRWSGCSPQAFRRKGQFGLS